MIKYPLWHIILFIRSLDICFLLMEFIGLILSLLILKIILTNGGDYHGLLLVLLKKGKVTTPCILQHITRIFTISLASGRQNRIRFLMDFLQVSEW